MDSQLYAWSGPLNLDYSPYKGNDVKCKFIYAQYHRPIMTRWRNDLLIGCERRSVHKKIFKKKRLITDADKLILDLNRGVRNHIMPDVTEILNISTHHVMLIWWA